MKKRKLQWHPAFAAVLRIEFENERDMLVFEDEHLLGKKPLQIDVLVVKKQKDLPIQKNIGRIFREHNLIEYKPPGDYLSINDFYKVYGYACLYQSDTEHVMSIHPEQITLTFVCNHFPQKMVQHLLYVRNLKIEKIEDGIYYLNGDTFPIQILVNKELPKSANYWLQHLRNDLKAQEEIPALLEQYEKKKDSKLYQSAMDLIIHANWKTMEEVNQMCNALRELLADELKESNIQGYNLGITQGISQGISQGIFQGITLTKTVLKLAGSGKTPDQISLECGISKKEVLEILE